MSNWTVFWNGGNCCPIEECLTSCPMFAMKWAIPGIIMTFFVLWLFKKQEEAKQE